MLEVGTPGGHSGSEALLVSDSTASGSAPSVTGRTDNSLPGNPPRTRDDYPHMRCQPYRDAISAHLDGEETGVAEVELEGHLDACAGCQAFTTSSRALHRRIAIRPADPVPDLTAQILATASKHLPVVAPSRAANGLAGASGASRGNDGQIHWSRWALLGVALMQLTVALPPVLFGHDAGAPVHLAREIGAWDIALAMALLLVVMRPRRAQGLVPFAASLAVAMFGAALVDVGSGRATPLAESQHLLELAGLWMLWVLSRQPVDDSPLLPGLGRHRNSVAA